MDYVSSLEGVTRQDLLAWVDYPHNSAGICFPCPRYVISGDKMVEIRDNVFQGDSSVLVMLAGGYDSSYIRSTYGEVVICRINEDELRANSTYSDYQSNSQSFYRSVLNPNYGGLSHFEFKPFSRNPLKNSLVQVAEVEGSPIFTRPGVEVTLRGKMGRVITDLVLISVRTKRGERLWGPFSAKSVPGTDRLRLEAEGGAFDYRAFSFESKGNLRPHALYNREGEKTFTFVDAEDVRQAVMDKTYKAQADWLPNDRLIAALMKAIDLSADAREFGKKQMRRIRRDISNLAEQSVEYTLDESRRAKVVELAGEVEYFSGLPDKIQDAVFESLSDDKLADIVSSPGNLPRFQERLLTIPELRAGVEQERARLSSTLDGLRDEVEQERALRDEARAEHERVTQELEEARKGLDAQIEQARRVRTAELEELERACRESKAKLGELERQVKGLDDDKTVLEEELDHLSELLGDRMRLASEVIRTELVQRVVATANGTRQEAADNKRQEAFPQLVLDQREGPELIERLVDVVAERSGRSYERNDVINFYTCLTQGYITTFAGMPGTGKTSLARLLATGLGIEGDDRGHFVEVSVERGWTSFHDYIGYFNPLTRCEERSNPEMFSALERLGQEAGADASAVAPYLFLLDEANLSPIEHYWSPFLRACDSFDHQSMRLPLGGDRALIIPSHTRFVATVNYDHTTEDLSPRFLDRSWVILLRPDDLADLGGDAELSGAQTSGEAVSYASLTNTFGRRSAISMSEASEEVFKRVLSIMGAARHPVSPRSRQMMAHYITTATELMGASGVSGVYDPVDFAVAQKVLPEISGPREQCESLLEDLAEACARLNVTTEIIERMKSEGDASGYYQFFV